MKATIMHGDIAQAVITMDEVTGQVVVTMTQSTVKDLLAALNRALNTWDPTPRTMLDLCEALTTLRQIYEK